MFLRVGDLLLNYFFVDLVFVLIVYGVDIKKLFYNVFNLRWRNFMSMDYELNVLKDDVKMGSEIFVKNKKVMEEFLFDF